MKKDKIVLQVISKFEQRSEFGIKKYGTTLEENNLSIQEWITHAQEEAMDFCLYLEKLRSELKSLKPRTPEYGC